MKICPKCNSANNDEAIVCKTCGESLSKVDKSIKEYINEMIEADEKKHRRMMLVHNIVMPIIGCLYYYLVFKYIIQLRSDVVTNIFVFIGLGIFIPLVVYFAIHHPEVGFYFKHMCDVDNIDDVQLSDFYYLSSKVEAYIIIIVAFIYLIFRIYIE